VPVSKVVGVGVALLAAVTSFAVGFAGASTVGLV
jgi:hypothetical protein